MTPAEAVVTGWTVLVVLLVLLLLAAVRRPPAARGRRTPRVPEKNFDERRTT